MAAAYEHWVRGPRACLLESLRTATAAGEPLRSPCATTRRYEDDGLSASCQPRPLKLSLLGCDPSYSHTIAPFDPFRPAGDLGFARFRLDLADW